MAGHGVVSADSHVVEPGDLWQLRLDRAYRDRAPHIVENTGDGTRLLFVGEGMPSRSVAGATAAGTSGKDLKKFFDESSYEDARAGGWDPVVRLEDQETDGIDAEVLYPSLGMSLFAMSDGGLQRACFHAYNGWLADYCSHAPTRLYGIGLISLEDIDLAVRDLEGIVQQGMRGAMIWGSPPADRPYDDRRYDPFWQAASEAQLPVSLHIIAGRGSQSEGASAGVRGDRSFNPGVWYMTVLHEIQESITRIIFGGVLERHPELRIVSVENDTGWIPHFIYRMNHVYEKFYSMWPEPLPMPPGDYIRRQVHATFQDDPIGPRLHDIFGTDNYMWASDFPHSDSTFPESRAWIEKNFAGVPDDVKRRIVYDNAVALYGMNLT